MRSKNISIPEDVYQKLREERRAVPGTTGGSGNCTTDGLLRRA